MWVGGGDEEEEQRKKKKPRRDRHTHNRVRVPFRKWRNETFFCFSSSSSILTRRKKKKSFWVFLFYWGRENKKHVRVYFSMSVKILRPFFSLGWLSWLLLLIVERNCIESDVWKKKYKIQKIPFCFFHFRTERNVTTIVRRIIINSFQERGHEFRPSLKIKEN